MGMNFLNVSEPNPSNAVFQSRSFTKRAVVPMLFGLFWLVLMHLSWTQYTHYALTRDFALYHQAWFEIAHGHWNPTMFMQSGPFYKNHLEVLLWVLSGLYWIWPHSFWLLALQDSAIAASAYVAWAWIEDLLRTTPVSQQIAWVLRVVAILLLTFNPWVIRAVTFDFHFQDLAGFFVIAAAWQFYRDHNRWGFFWVALAASTGNVSMTYLVGVGVSVIMVDRGRRMRGWGTLAVGFGGFLLSEHLGVHLGAVVTSVHSASAGQGSQSTSLLLGLISHPGHLAGDLWNWRRDVYANVAPEGFLGLLSIWAWPTTLLILVENSLGGALFVVPGFQSDPMYALLTVGTVGVLVRVASRRPRVAAVAALLATLNLIGWAWAWVPAIVPNLFTDGIGIQSAVALRRIEGRVPADAEVVASQGILGRFAGRQNASPFPTSGPIPIRSTKVVFIIAPYAGINESSTEVELRRIAYLTNLPRAHLLAHRAGVWAFEWDPPSSTRTLTIPSKAVLPAWGAGTIVGVPVTVGPVKDWHMAVKSQQAGYIIDKAYWRLANGVYGVTIRLAESGPTNLEVWNATGHQLLRRFDVPTTNGIETEHFTFRLSRQYPRHLYTGFGPFRMQPVAPSTRRNNIELRIWTPGNETVDVYGLTVNQIDGG